MYMLKPNEAWSFTNARVQIRTTTFSKCVSPFLGENHPSLPHPPPHPPCPYEKMQSKENFDSLLYICRRKSVHMLIKAGTHECPKYPKCPKCPKVAECPK